MHVHNILHVFNSVIIYNLVFSSTLRLAILSFLKICHPKNPVLSQVCFTCHTFVQMNSIKLIEHILNTAVMCGTLWYRYEIYYIETCLMN